MDIVIHRISTDVDKVVDICMSVYLYITIMLTKSLEFDITIYDLYPWGIDKVL